MGTAGLREPHGTPGTHGTLSAPRRQAAGSTRRAVVLAGGAALLGVATAGVTACGQVPVPEIAPGRSYTAPRPAKLTLQLDATWDVHRVLRERLLRRFTQRHPGMQVTLVTGPVELPAWRRQAAAGTTPDLALFGASQAPAIAAGKLTVALDDRTAAWGHLGDFLPASLISSQWAGTRWGLPLAVEVRLHLWRKSVLEAAEIERVPATWEDVTEAVRRSVLVERGAIVREGYPRPEGWGGFTAALATLGRTLFVGGQAELGGAEGLAALNHLLDIQRATRPMGTPQLRQGTRGGAYPFASGALAHTVDNATPLRALALTYPRELANVVVGDPPVPAPAAQAPATTGGTSNLGSPTPAVTVAPAGTALQAGTATSATTATSAAVIPAGRPRPVTVLSADWLGIGAQSQAQDQAWALLQYLLEPATMLPLCEPRAFRPPRKSLASAAYLQQPHLRRMTELADRYGQPTPRVPDSTVFRDTLRAMLDETLSGRTPPEQALAAAVRRLQQAVDQAGFKGDTL